MAVLGIDIGGSGIKGALVDLETGEHLNLYADNVRQDYKTAVQKYFNELKIKCGQYRIKYVPVNINEDFSAILTSYFVERQKFK